MPAGSSRETSLEFLGQSTLPDSRVYLDDSKLQLGQFWKSHDLIHLLRRSPYYTRSPVASTNCFGWGGCASLAPKESDSNPALLSEAGDPSPNLAGSFQDDGGGEEGVKDTRKEIRKPHTQRRRRPGRTSMSFRYTTCVVHNDHRLPHAGLKAGATQDFGLTGLNRQHMWYFFLIRSKTPRATSRGSATCCASTRDDADDILWRTPIGSPRG